MNNRNIKKNRCQTEIFSPDILLKCNSQQRERVQSVGSKRFVRKRQSNKHPNNISLTILHDQNKLNPDKNRKSLTLQNKDNKDLANTFVKTKDLLLNITVNSSKNINSIPLISSERYQTSKSQLKICNQTQRQSKLNIPTIKKIKVDAFKSELQRKTAQIQALNKQNSDIKRKTQQKQQQFYKQKKKIQKRYEMTITKFQIQIQTITEQLRIKQQQIAVKDIQISNYHKKQHILINQLNAALNTQRILQMQIDELRKNIIDKQAKDLISYRQKSLMKQVDQLKKQLKDYMGDNQKLMQKQMLKLKQDLDQKNQKYRDLQIYNRVISRKITEKDKQFKVKISQFNRSYSQIKESQKEVIDELKKIRRQNQKLKRLNTLHSSRNRKNICSASSTSLNLSLSSGYGP